LAPRGDDYKTFDGWNIETQCCVGVGLPMPNHTVKMNLWTLPWDTL
jgi:hypothetical protein